MSSIDAIVDSFILENDLDDSIKPSLEGLINKCFEGVFKHFYNLPIPESGSTSKPKANKVLKSEKIEDPAECQSRDQLHCCTTVSLSAFCKNNGLKVGGNKTDVIDRVWRFLQGNTSAEDKSPRGTGAKAKKVAEKHICSGCNAKGEKCGVAGTERWKESDYWFCWQHIFHAEETIAKLEDPNQPKPKERAPKTPKAAKTEAKAKDTKAKEAKAKAKSKAKASGKAKDDLESESESETEPEPVKKSKSKGKAKPKEESESESEAEAEPVKKSKAKAKAEPKKKIPEPETESEEEESEAEDQDSEDERKAYYAKLAREQIAKEVAALEEEE
jgi:hypothetical protein